MAVTFERIEGLRWEQGASARLWYIQPHLRLPEASPYQQLKAAERRTGLELTEAVLRYEQEHYDAPAQAPTFVLLPEFGLHVDDIPHARSLLAVARPNTILIAGVGQLSADEARRTDPTADVWDGPAEGRFTNLAIIGHGGDERVFIQPKMIASRWETGGTHWPGRVVRCFEGASILFAVVICSDLVDQPDDATTASRLIADLRENNKRLDVLVWLQHNMKPRSGSFHSSIESLARALPAPTVLVVSSRAGDPARRYENHAVSGALVHHDVLPGDFDMLDHRFRYVEPITPQLPMARVVLLRYDVDAFLVRTVQPTVVHRDDGTAKGRVYDEAVPFVLDGSTLRACDRPDHIRDLTEPAATVARESNDDLSGEIGAVQSALAELGTARFMGFLDLAFAPRPASEDVRHAPLHRHGRGDFLCDCWPHRKCLDYLCSEAHVIAELARVLAAAAALRRVDPLAEPRFVRERRANFVMHLEGRPYDLAVVNPLGLDAEHAARAITGGKPSLTDVPYVVLGTKEWRSRRRLASTEAAYPNPTGALQAGQMALPLQRAVFYDEFWQAFDEGRLAGRMRDLLTAGSS